uniref:Uncharacterized protein n=1 Tax=Arundo donax TaxID=35708 RepID=A0A0A9F950_ARUDO
MAEGVHLLGAQHMRSSELPALAPVLTVGCKRDVCRAIADDVRGHGWWPRREDVVVGAQDGLGGARGGHEQGGHGTDANEQEAVAAILGIEVSDGYVGLGAEEVEVADDRQLAWR